MPVNWKDDARPAKGGWAPGGYLCKCVTCAESFCGDKRAQICADCAYRDPTPAERDQNARFRAHLAACFVAGMGPEHALAVWEDKVFERDAMLIEADRGARPPGPIHTHGSGGRYHVRHHEAPRG